MCSGGFCRCYHLHQVALGDIVDLFLIDEGLPWDVSHPFHLHGTHFQVAAILYHSDDIGLTKFTSRVPILPIFRELPSWMIVTYLTSFLSFTSPAHFQVVAI
jgi:hypothetical protein